MSDLSFRGFAKGIPRMVCRPFLQTKKEKKTEKRKEARERKKTKKSKRKLSEPEKKKQPKRTPFGQILNSKDGSGLPPSFLDRILRDFWFLQEGSAGRVCIVENLLRNPYTDLQRFCRGFGSQVQLFRP